VVVHIYDPSQLGDLRIVQAISSENLSQKQNANKRARLLLSICITKIKQNNKRCNSNNNKNLTKSRETIMLPLLPPSVAHV
jgi:hypothetical protein